MGPLRCSGCWSGLRRRFLSPVPIRGEARAEAGGRRGGHCRPEKDARRPGAARPPSAAARTAGGGRPLLAPRRRAGAIAAGPRAWAGGGHEKLCRPRGKALGRPTPVPAAKFHSLSRRLRVRHLGDGPSISLRFSRDEGERAGSTRRDGSEAGAELSFFSQKNAATRKKQRSLLPAPLCHPPRRARAL